MTPTESFAQLRATIAAIPEVPGTGTQWREMQEPRLEERATEHTEEQTDLGI